MPNCLGLKVLFKFVAKKPPEHKPVADTKNLNRTWLKK